MLLNPQQIPEAVSRVRERMAKAAEKAKRSLTDIALMAVTKFIPVPQIRAVRSCGIDLIGESRVQEGIEKMEGFEQSPCPEGPFSCHFIGHLQTNKAKKAAGTFDCIQSLDSLPLAEKLNAAGEVLEKKISCLVELKISEEGTKFGVSAGNLGDFLDKTKNFPHIQVEGLMAMAPYFENPEETRPYFKLAKSKFDEHRKHFGDKAVLSMGMSNDFETAVEEGSTLVRIGTALFGDRYD